MRAKMTFCLDQALKAYHLGSKVAEKMPLKAYTSFSGAGGISFSSFFTGALTAVDKGAKEIRFVNPPFCFKSG